VKKQREESKPWDPRPISPMGDSREDAIFCAVGQTPTEWEVLESACAQLFAVLVSANHKRAYLAPAIRAYGTISSAATRQQMLVNAGEAYFSRPKGKAQKHEAEFNERMNAYSKFASKRNEIAHGLVQRVFLTKRGIRPAAIGLYLTPSFYNPRKFKNEQLSYLYTSSDLIFYRQEFTNLALRVGGLKERMQSKTGHPRERTQRDDEMKFVDPHPFTDPNAAARKLVEIANGLEAVQEGRIYIERINEPFLAAAASNSAPASSARLQISTTVPDNTPFSGFARQARQQVDVPHCLDRLFLARTPRSRGRSVVVLYNCVRTHRSLNKDAPV
jgi:hypothetical protein